MSDARGADHSSRKTADAGIRPLLCPSPLVGICLLWVLLLQCVFLTSGSATYSAGGTPIRSSYRLGIGGPVEIATESGLTTTRVRWPVLIANLLASYGVAVGLARIWERATRFRRPAVSFGWMAAGMLGIMFLLSVGFSRYYWGYALRRPPVLREIREPRRILAVIPIRTETDAEGHRRIVAHADYSLADSLTRAREDSYYNLHPRLLLALDERGALPEAVATDLSAVPEMHALIRHTGILAKPEAGYPDADHLSGVAILAEGPSNRRRLFLGVSGRQAANDHYPYYEMLFESGGTGGDGAFSYIRGHRFFFDVAGIEGMEWPAVWLTLAVPGIATGYALVPVLAIGMRKFRNVTGSGSGG